MAANVPPGIGDLWPYIVFLIGVYGALLKVIQSMYDSRIADLTKERDRWEALALQGMTLAQRTTEVTGTIVRAGTVASDGGPPS